MIFGGYKFQVNFNDLLVMKTRVHPVVTKRPHIPAIQELLYKVWKSETQSHACGPTLPFQHRPTWAPY
jgi:hypothetical protein